MDGQRFDHVTRLIGSGASRRSVLKGLTGALIGAAGLVGARSSAIAGSCGSEGAACGAQGDLPCCPEFVCGKGSCIGEGPICTDVGGECGDVPAQGRIECCSGLVCIDSTCQPACVDVGEECGNLDGFEVPCCEGFACSAEGICESIIPEPECGVDADCVAAAAGDFDAAICCGGFCITGIECCIDDEDPNARCAEGATCFEGICVFACKGDADCASGT